MPYGHWLEDLSLCEAKISYMIESAIAGFNVEDSSLCVVLELRS